MTTMDRSSFIAQLDRLGDPDDAVALAAARAVAAQVAESGIGWNTLIVDPDAAPPTAGATSAYTAEPAPDDDGEDADSPVSEVTLAADAAIIDRMLVELELSDATRTELTDLRAAIAGGEYTRMDSRYLRGLYARLASQSVVPTDAPV